MGSGWEEKREQQPGVWKWQGGEYCDTHRGSFFLLSFIIFFFLFVLIGVFVIWLGPYC